MSRPALLHLRTGGLIAAAGGDPWSVDASLRAGSPTQIDFLAGAFQQAGQSTVAAQTLFRSARSHLGEYQRGDRIQPAGDLAGVGQRCRDALGEKTLAGAGHGAVDGGEQRAAAVAMGGAGEFQADAAGGVDAHERFVE